MLQNSHAAVGVFRQDWELHAAKLKLLQIGFKDSRMTTQQLGPRQKRISERRVTTRIRGGALIGGAVGAILFLLCGLLLGEILLLPLALVLGGIYGAAAGALVGIGTPSREPVSNTGKFQISVSVENATDSQKALSSLEKSGAQKISLLAPNS